MAKDSTELDDMNMSVSQKNTDRASWNSYTSEDSNAQTTLYSPTQLNHNIRIDPKNYELQNNTFANYISPSLTSHKHTFVPLSSSQPEEEENQEGLPTSSATYAQPSTPQSPTDTAISKPNILDKLLASLPVFAQMRKTIKAAIALLIGIIFIFEPKTRAASGSSVLLVPIVVIFYFPVRTIGILFNNSTIYIYNRLIWLFMFQVFKRRFEILNMLYQRYYMTKRFIFKLGSYSWYNGWLISCCMEFSGYISCKSSKR